MCSFHYPKFEALGDLKTGETEYRIFLIKLLTCNILLLMLKAIWRTNWQLSTGQFWTVKISTMIYSLLYTIQFSIHMNLYKHFRYSKYCQNWFPLDCCNWQWNKLPATNLFYKCKFGFVKLLDKDLKAFQNYSFFFSKEIKIVKK